MPLSDADREAIVNIAKLEVREYFDHYLNVVLPRQEKANRHHTHLTVEAHNSSRKAHGGVEQKVNRMRWVLVGLGTGLGFLGGLGGKMFAAAVGLL